MRRAESWAKIDDATVLRLTVAAVDEQDQRVLDFTKEVKDEMSQMNARLGKILWVMIGILVTLTSGALLFAATAGGS